MASKKEFLKHLKTCAEIRRKRILDQDLYDSLGDIMDYFKVQLGYPDHADAWDILEKEK